MNIAGDRYETPLRDASDEKIGFQNALPSGLIANDNRNHSPGA
jgi:hypothetical protein